MPIPMNDEDMTLVAALETAAALFSNIDSPRSRQNHTVCLDIARRVRQFGRFASVRQRSYAEALVSWSRPQSPTQQARAEVQQDAAARNTERRTLLMSSTTLARIVQLMTAASRNGLQFPKIRLQRGEWKIRIYPAPAMSRNAGGFYVKANRSLYCGVIQPDGAFRPSAECPLDVIEALREFNDAPERVATAYGHATSSCCFCGRGLTDARSVAMGYGPVCAESYGLAWGEERAAQSVTLTPEQISAMAASDVANGYERQRAHAATIPPRRRDLRSDSYLERIRTRNRLRREQEERERGALGRQTPTDDDEDSHFM